MRIFVSLTVVLVLGGGILWTIFWHDGASEPNQLSADNPLLLPNPDPTIDTYISGKYGFRVEFPRGMMLTIGDEGGGAQTVSFEDVVGGWGFQVFVVPYKEHMISEERFLKDVPSGVRNDPKQTQVGGVFAETFTSKHDVLGDTFEVWFLHGGYLFEVTTPKAFEANLLEVLQTWQFLKK